MNDYIYNKGFKSHFKIQNITINCEYDEAENSNTIL